MIPRRLVLLSVLFLLPPVWGESVANYADLATDGAWCWFSDPRAVYAQGKVFAGWIAADGSVKIGAHDPSTGATKVATLAEKFEVDDHDNPALLLLPDGRLATFYSRHASGDMHFRTTTKPGDIDEWTPDRTLGFQGSGRHGATYANPVMLAAESDAIYVFWRGSDFKPTFSLSKDLGQTWSAPRTLLQRPGAGDTNRPYVKAWSDGYGRIDFVFTDGHPRNEENNSVYFFRYEKGAFFKADGTRIGGFEDLPLDPANCDRIYSGTTAGRAWIWDVAERYGQPVVAYTRLPSDLDHRYHYARWDGARWVDAEIVAAGKWFPQTPNEKQEREPHYSGGMALDQEQVDTVYVSRPVNGVFEIERWRTPDGGQTWRSEAITSESKTSNVRPFVVRRAPPGEPYLMWMNLNGRYVHYTDFRTSLKINDALMPAALPPLSTAMEARAVLTAMERVADWQLAHPSRVRPDDWIPAAAYTGIMALAEISSQPKYLAAMKNMGERNDWKLGPRKYHADDHSVGQTYAELYLREYDAHMIEPMRKQLDEILADGPEGDLDFTKEGVTDRWSWCDSLFMAPPVWIRLWAATHDRRYLDYAVNRWWKTSDYLYSKDEHLYFRDSTYFGKREVNGKCVFWSRGNGWVMGGLVRMLELLPKDHPSRPRFEQQFREMAAKLLALQQDDGMWRASLLDPQSYPLKETSGTGFYCYAFAWGINNGLLAREIYGPAAAKAWAALISCVEPDGRLTHVQPVGADPKRFDGRSTDAYGVGAFLLAGSEIYALARQTVKP